MITLTFISPDGVRHEVQAEPGLSLMEAAVNNGIPGIEGECGGCCACATCHVVTSDATRALIGEKVGDEADLLDFTEGVESNSRLGCQINITETLEGAVFHVKGG